MKTHSIVNGDIDIVLPWVDGSDPKWQQEKNKYERFYEGDKGENRYRDWGMLPYLFRGIEKFLPWIRQVHFITCGHLPEWLDTSCEKLNIVKHSDYIPEKYLPTFSSHPIELNMHRIKNLSDRFIYINDDLFFIDYMSPDDFFINGLPTDYAVMGVLQFTGKFDHIIANDLEVINRHFKKKKSVHQNYKKWYTLKYGKGTLKNLYLLPFSYFVGFDLKHLPMAYLKSTIQELWNEEFDTMDRTCTNKFRSIMDVNQYLFRYWQLAKGNFMPEKNSKGKCFGIGKDDAEIKKTIDNQKYKMICLNDNDENIDFEEEKDKITGWFEKILPDKSSFEK